MITPIIDIVKGVNFLIVFDKLFYLMQQKGVSTYQLREKCGIDSKTVRRLKANDNMETKTLNKLCTVLDCKVEDIMEYIPD
ncbi:MAG: helix-turn-helix transcriptional regulator [Ruminococcaceae bacterium]|nr:helix-turn-helix transcriptional regulator [Oscillospiraceae bacterium]